MEKNYAEIVINAKGLAGNKFIYRIPSELEDKIKVGNRVLVPFTNRKLEGYIFKIVSESPILEKKVREIICINDDEQLFGEEVVSIVEWMVERYNSTYFKTLKLFLPPGTNYNEERIIRIKNEENIAERFCDLKTTAQQILERIILNGGEIDYNDLKDAGEKGLMRKLRELQKDGYIEIEEGLSKAKVGKLYETTAELTADPMQAKLLVSNLKRSPKQAEALKLLIENNGYLTATEINNNNISLTTLRGLEKKGLLRLVKKEKKRLPKLGYIEKRKKNYSLNEDQIQVINHLMEAIRKREKITFLLHGVTGSGKTEVYLQLINSLLIQNKGSIVLVPEISLTPQTVSRFKERFQEKVAVLHSRLSLGERYDEWRRIKSGEAKVVVGARSAVFAPVSDLGIIIIDEEHEDSYKQEGSPKYSTHEVAEKRAMVNQGILLLGTATPSIETYYKALTGEYQLLELKSRVDSKPMPEVHIIDMRQELKKGNRGIFSTFLVEKMKEKIYQREQVILFINRRGFANFMLCRECGNTIKCKKCDVSMTYHATDERLHCHYCESSMKIPKVCPNCGSKYIRQFGVGTQRVESETKKIFPNIRIARMDLDNITRKGSQEMILKQFSERQVDVLVGTQMISKGLDFPSVTLVGIINADTALNLPDYRAGEKTFQQITQVAGRAGRGEVAGEVIVQTYNPQHYSIQAAKHHDYPKFFYKEIKARKTLGYPPFKAIGRILITGKVEEDLIKFSHIISEQLRNYAVKYDRVDVLGPAPAPISKLNNQYRWQIMIKGQDYFMVDEMLRFAKEGGNNNLFPCEILTEINPNSLL
jgi:primosomal protein N' (replication factor Y)